MHSLNMECGIIGGLITPAMPAPEILTFEVYLVYQGELDTLLCITCVI